MKNSLKKLLIFKHNKKRFQICLDNNRDFVFLEIRNSSAGKEYYDYPELDDCIYLAQIFNNYITFTSNSIIDSNKPSFNSQKFKPFKHRIRTAIGYITISVFVSAMLMNTNAYALSNSKHQTATQTKIVNQTDDHTFIKSADELDEFLGKENISEADMLEAINSNPNFNDDELEYVKIYIKQLYDKYPEIDKRLFYESIKDMKFIYEDKLNGNEEIAGRTDYQDHAIRIKNSNFNYNIVFHELTHFLFEGVFERNKIRYAKMFGAEFFGKSIIEGMTCNISEEISEVPLVATNIEYIREYRFIKRLMLVLGEERLISIVSGQVNEPLKDILIKESGLPKQVETISIYNDSINSITYPDDKDNYATLLQYMEAEIDIFFKVQETKLSDKKKHNAIGEYLNNRRMYVQNIGQYPEIIRMFWQKEGEYLSDYLSLINSESNNVSMISALSFNNKNNISSYDTNSMSIVVASSNKGGTSILISNNKSDVEMYNIHMNGDQIYLVGNSDIKNNAFASGTIDCLTNYPIPDDTTLLTAINLNDYLTSTNAQINDIISRDRSFTLSAGIEMFFNLESAISYLEQQNSLEANDNEYGDTGRSY